MTADVHHLMTLAAIERVFAARKVKPADVLGGK